MSDVGAFAAETFASVGRKATDLRLGQNGPIFLTFFGYKGDPSQSFTLEADFPYFTKNEQYQGPFAYGAAAKFKCACVIYQGPLAGSAAAWEKLVQDARNAGYHLTDESREVFLNWEDAESKNGVIELQLGIE